jgi:sugar/nucleoside kinase (ribokinase family)
MEKAKWLYLTSLSGDWRLVLAKIFSVDRPRIAWNPGHRQILAGVKVLGKYFQRADCLIINKDEAIEIVLSDKKYKSASFLNNVKNLLLALASYGSKIVVITNGRCGADVWAHGRFFHQPIVKERRRIDTTGVGDAFGSSFIAGLELYNQDIKKALQLAARNSAAEIGQQGAQQGLLRKKDI